MAFIKTVRRGIRYMELWPDDPLLRPVFPEGRCKYAMSAARYILPPFIVLILAWAFVRGGGLHHGIDFMFALKHNWHVTAACVLNLLLMPLYGYYWFGCRAAHKLNPKLKLFYAQTCRELGMAAKNEPEMYDLAQVLRQGIESLGRDFLRRL